MTSLKPEVRTLGLTSAEISQHQNMTMKAEAPA